MSDSLKLISIGKLGKPKGLHGQLHAYFQIEFASRLKKHDTFFLSVRGKKLPYSVEELDIDPSGSALILLEEIDNRTKSESFRGAEIFTPESNLKKLSKANAGDNFIGFTVTDKVHGLLGVVDDMFQLPSHPMVQVSFQGKNILIPLVEEYELKINPKAKTISLLLPDGFLEI